MFSMWMWIFTLHIMFLWTSFEIGVNDSILYGENVVSGQYYTGNPGKQPDWWTTGTFRWMLTIESLKEAVKYISTHPNAKDSIIKSKTIFALIMENEPKLRGLLHIGGATPNRDNEPCEMIRNLTGGFYGWNGKWMYSESLELLAPKTISKHEISTSIYGKIKPDSIVYDLLGFKKTESDEVDALKKTMTTAQLDALFENELKQRFGLSASDLAAHFEGTINSTTYQGTVDDDEFDYAFPVARVKNWETLKKHAAEMLCFADPVKYDYAVRRVHV